MQKGGYKIKKELLSKTSGSVLDQWIKMGMPEELGKEEIEYLKNASVPKREYWHETSSGELEIKADLDQHDIQLFTITKLQ